MLASLPVTFALGGGATIGPPAAPQPPGRPGRLSRARSAAQASGCAAGTRESIRRLSHGCQRERMERGIRGRRASRRPRVRFVAESQASGKSSMVEGSSPFSGALGFRGLQAPATISDPVVWTSDLRGVPSEGYGYEPIESARPGLFVDKKHRFRVEHIQNRAGRPCR